MDTNNEQYELKGPDADAQGVFTESGFLVKAGSLARRVTAPSAQGLSAVHQRLLAEGILEEYEGKLRFTRDYQFSSARSPSARSTSPLSPNSSPTTLPPSTATALPTPSNWPSVKPSDAS